MNTDDNKISPKRTAIIAGINDYESHSVYQTLGGAENDAKEISERLQKNGDFEISKGHYLIGQNATRKNILKAISDVFRKDASFDVVALYFSGHGILDKNNVGYIAPYDMDPEDPFVSGINMEQLRTVIYESKNQASVIMLLDCCHSGIAAKDKTKTGPVTTTVMDTNRDLISTQFQKMVESPSQQGPQVTQVTARGAVILASSEANAVSRERNYIHSNDDKPHSHGAFTFHLIEGIDGKAADKSGVITIGSLKKYVEDKMLEEDRQIPVHYVAGASRIDSIHVALSQDRFRATVDNLISTAQGLLVFKYPNSDLIDLQYLSIASKKVSELASLEPNNEELPILYKIINEGAARFSQPAIEWLVKNSDYARRKLNEIEPSLYDFRLPDMVQNLSYDELQKMDQTTLKTLNTLLAEVARNTEFKAEDDKNLNRFYLQLRASLHNNFNATKPGHV
ncbi:MAG: caspase family protein [Nitrososphaeraceae archaeon]